MIPALIEVIPPEHPADAAITVPGSKSITNRALVLAALADGRTRLTGALWSEDTEVMVAALKALEIEVTVRPDAEEPGNREFIVQGTGGRFRAGGPPSHPLELFVGNAGTAARFLAAMLCLGRGAYRLSGVPRMHERPQGELFTALRALGYEVESERGTLPAVIHGGGWREGRVTVGVSESSQFASALLLGARHGGWQVTVEGHSEEESPYVSMTERMVEQFPRGGGTFAIEPDASSGSYPWAAGFVRTLAGLDGGNCEVRGWPRSGWQIDARFPAVFTEVMAGRLDSISRQRHLGDSIMTAIAIAPLLDRPIEFTDLGRLRLQECERVAALRNELTKCGAEVIETGDTLRIAPSRLHGAEIETYEDHRMAMCFGVLGLAVPGMRIRNPACVAKTYPGFWRMLAAPSPSGLGATLVDCASGEEWQPGPD